MRRAFIYKDRTHAGRSPKQGLARLGSVDHRHYIGGSPGFSEDRRASRSLEGVSERRPKGRNGRRGSMHEDRLVHFLYETAGRLRTDAENFCARAMTKLEILLAEEGNPTSRTPPAIL